MKTTTLLGSISLLLVTATGCGSGLKCADGTFKSGAKCIAFDPDDETPPVTTLDPPGGKTRIKTPTFATLATDEPALIFFTTDGSEPDPEGEGHPTPALVTDLVEGATVKFFAIDLAGNVEATRSTTFTFDPFPPASVELVMAFVGSDAELTWANPSDADFQGTLLARVTGSLDALPELDTFYTAGMTLSTNVEIVQVGTQTSFTDPGVGPGDDPHYVAWTFDDIANYSPPASVRGTDVVGITTGAVNIDVTTTAVTVTSAPTYLNLSGTSSFAAGTLTVNLSVENVSTHYFQSPRIRVDSVTPGTFSNSDATIDGFGTKYYGPNHLSPGNLVTRTLTFTGVALTDNVALNVSLTEYPFLFSSNNRTNPTTTLFNDSRLGGAVGTGTLSNGNVDGPGGSRGISRPGCASVDGRYFYVGYQHDGAIERYDMSIRATAGTVESGTARMTSTVLCDRVSDGLYVIQSQGGRRGGPQGSVLSGHAVVKLAPDLTELGRVTFSALKEYGMHGGSISVGGRYVAVTLSSEVVFVDTKTMTLVDTDPSTAGIDYLQTNIDGNSRGIRNSAWSTDGVSLYLQGAFERGVTRVNMPNGPGGGNITIDSFASCCPARGGEVEVGPDGKVWVASDIGLERFDPSTDIVTTMPYGSGARGLEFLDGELYVQRNNLITVDVVDTAGNIVPGRTISLPSTNRHHGLRSTRTD